MNEHILLKVLGCLDKEMLEQHLVKKMNIALILSGGVGSRLAADIPKQYLKVNNRTIISYCLEQGLVYERYKSEKIWDVYGQKRDTHDLTPFWGEYRSLCAS